MLFRMAPEAEDDASDGAATPFVLFFLGANMRRKLTRVCDSLGCVCSFDRRHTAALITARARVHTR